MNDRQDPYGQVYGYDEYGRPLYGTVPQQPQPQPPAQTEYEYQYDGYDYSGGQQQAQTYPGYDTQQGYHEGYQGDQGYDYGTAQQPAFAPQPPAPPAPPTLDPQPPAAQAPVPPARRAPDEGYRTEQFSFVEEQDEESEDVIDWLKFSESRTERREEAKRRSQNRRRLLVVVLVLALLGGTGYLWASGRLPFLPGPDGTDEAGGAAEQRDVIVVHLRQIDSDETATALLVANETAATGTTLLLPNDLAVTPDGGTTTLGQAVTDEAAGSVRDSLGGLLGADIRGTWRLDTPYLEILVDLVGGITLTTDAEVPAAEEDAEDPLVPMGEDVQLDGRAAVAYATHRGADETQSAQLARFGQVLQGAVTKMPSGESGATQVVQGLGQITDPSLTEEELGVSLARLAGYAQDDAYTTTALPVEPDGTLSDETADGLVADVLGGTVSNADPDAAPRIGIRDASGGEGAAETARITLVNGGFTVADSRAADRTSPESAVTYTTEAHRETALEAARTLGLPEESVTQGEGAGNADVTIILGEDYGQ